jgi:hypothetical protein
MLLLTNQSIVSFIEIEIWNMPVIVVRKINIFFIFLFCFTLFRKAFGIVGHFFYISHNFFKGDMSVQKVAVACIDMSHFFALCAVWVLLKQFYFHVLLSHLIDTHFYVTHCSHLTVIIIFNCYSCL